MKSRRNIKKIKSRKSKTRNRNKIRKTRKIGGSNGGFLQRFGDKIYKSIVPTQYTNKEGFTNNQYQNVERQKKENANRYALAIAESKQFETCPPPLENPTENNSNYKLTKQNNIQKIEYYTPFKEEQLSSGDKFYPKVKEEIYLPTYTVFYSNPDRVVYYKDDSSSSSNKFITITYKGNTRTIKYTNGISIKMDNDAYPKCKPDQTVTRPPNSS